VSSPVFFEAERQKFFRPLNSSRREVVVACLRALFERLHGPAADYSHNLNRESLRELMLPVVREYQDKVAEDEGVDEFNSPESNDPVFLTNVVIRALLADGWLEQFADRNGLVTAFRLSRPGKLFAEALWSLDRPSRSRQRNMRGCRNALEATLSDRGDAHDLVDAYEYAEKVIEDLTDGIDYLQQRIRDLMREATVHSQWDDFVEFLERFQRDYSKQLTADSATLNRQSIRQKIEALRVSLSDVKFKRMEQQLHDIAQWAVKEHTGTSVFDWLLDRIDDLVNAACETKQPTFVKAMDTYIRRVTGLVQQSMMVQVGHGRHAYLNAVKRLSGMDAASQDRLLMDIGNRIASSDVRLLDPASFKLRTVSQRRKASTISVQPRASREARLMAAMNRAESEAFSLPNEEIASKLRADLRLYRHPVRLSSLTPATARDLIGILQAVEAARNTKGSDLVATKLPQRIENEYYSGYDYEISFKGEE
jgi:hypothetical protein